MTGSRCAEPQVGHIQTQKHVMVYASRGRHVYGELLVLIAHIIAFSLFTVSPVRDVMLTMLKPSAEATKAKDGGVVCIVNCYLCCNACPVEYTIVAEHRIRV